MAAVDSHRDVLEAYRRYVGGERLGLHVRVGSAVVFAINSAFVALDFYAYRSFFSQFLVTRVLLNFVLLYCFFRGSKTNPRISEVFVCLATGAMLLIVVHGSGGAASDYYAGLILLFVGMPVLLPLTAAEAGGICAILFLGFCGMPIFRETTVDWAHFIVRAVFVGSAGFASVVSCSLLDRVRFKEFSQKREIEEARDALRELDEAKSRFTANIHHELRTPLTLMLAPLDSMLAGDFGAVSEMQQGYLGTMRRNALRLLKLINNLLDHARIESGQMQLHRQPLAVERVIDEVIESARAMAERKGVGLEGACRQDLPMVNADPDALEKVLVNLVGNALKFTDPGGRITVRAAAARAEDGEPGVELTVADTGAGIAPDQLERVFDRFAQVDGSATRRHEGTGIGLSLVRELALLHGGRAWAASEGLGRGSAFHVFLPVGREDVDSEEVVRGDDGRGIPLRRSLDALVGEVDARDALADEPMRHGEATSNPAMAAGYRTAELERTVERFEGAMASGGEPAAPRAAWLPDVVVAEDNADLRRLLVHLLGTDFSVRAARNGREALALVRERTPALVVTDVMMPEMSGTELCETIKADPALAGIPVMLVTSKAEREMKIRGLEMGADDYVTKPFHPRELLARARGLVRLRSLQEELAEQNAALDLALKHLRQTEVQLIQTERLAAVGELAAGVAHEVNNPVNFALNSLRILRENVSRVREFASRFTGIDWGDSAKLSHHAGELQRLEADVGLEEVASTLDELVRIVIEGLERTSRLVSDLRDFGAPGEREPVPVDVAAALDSTLELLGPMLGRAGVQLERTIESRLPGATGDPSALKQLFLNLLKNAAEALEEDGGTIRVTARRGPDDCELLVTVADDGPGIDPSLAERIFEPFFTTKAAGRGTGLGLSICRRIAEAHRGALEVTSTPGTGTMFTLRLPVESQDATELRT